MSRNRGEQRRSARTYSRNITPRMFVNGGMVLLLNQITDWVPAREMDRQDGMEDHYLNDHEPRAAKTQKQMDASRRSGQKASARAKATGSMWLGRAKDRPTP